MVVGLITFSQRLKPSSENLAPVSLNLESRSRNDLQPLPELPQTGQGLLGPWLPVRGTMGFSVRRGQGYAVIIPQGTDEETEAQRGQGSLKW